MIVMVNLIYLEVINEKVNKIELERELEKALAIEFLYNYCQKNKLSVAKLKREIFILSYNQCGFFHASDIKPIGVLNDIETQPKPTLIVEYENGKLVVKETEYTKITKTSHS